MPRPSGLSPTVRFTKCSVKIGLRCDGYVQISDGIQDGELVATEGALFLRVAFTISAR
jgi:hypothetical protein